MPAAATLQALMMALQQSKLALMRRHRYLAKTLLLKERQGHARQSAGSVYECCSHFQVCKNAASQDVLNR